MRDRPTFPPCLSRDVVSGRAFLQLAGFVLLASAAAANGDTDAQLTKELVGDRHFVPVDSFVGRLQLPKPEERRPDGGVFFVIERAPPAFVHLRHRRIWLREDLRNARVRRRYERTTRDVSFTPAVLENQQAGNIHPARLDGWRSVSPLESLAGARVDDDVRVAIRSASVSLAVDDVVITAKSAPYIVSGSHRALGRFIDTSGYDVVVELFDPLSGRFDAQRRLCLPAQRVATKSEAPMTSVDGLATADTPKTDFDLFVVERGDCVELAAIAPRALFRRNAFIDVIGRAAALRFVDEEMWRMPLRAGTHRSVALNGTSDSGQSSSALLVLHVFGGIGGPKGEGPPMPGVETGHFSLGEARWKVDTLTGEEVLDVTYWQLYAHNVEGIVAAPTAWHAYMGSLRRGWMYLRPVADAVVELPALETVVDAEVEATALDVLRHEVRIMAARYRSGDGTGGAIVTPSASCVQDSAQAVFAAITALEAMPISQDKHDRIAALRSLADDIEAELFPWAFLRLDWRDGRLAAAPARKPAGRVVDTLRALLTWPTVLPRSAHDNALKLALRRGSRVWLLRTDQIGGRIDGVKPKAPQSLLRR